MAKINTAPFAQNKRVGLAVATAAKTTYNDATGAVLLLTAGSDGAILRRITTIARATVSATQLQFYRSTDGGTTLWLWRTKLMAAATLSQTAEMPITDLGLDFDQAVGLAANERIYFGIGVALAAGIAATAEYEDF